MSKSVLDFYKLAAHAYSVGDEEGGKNSLNDKGRRVNRSIEVPVYSVQYTVYWGFIQLTVYSL